MDIQVKRIKKIVICLCLIFSLFLITGCNNESDENESVEEKENNTEEEINSSLANKNYEFGDLVTVEVTAGLTITGNVLEDKDGAITILQQGTLGVSLTYLEAEESIESLKDKWTNASDVIMPEVGYLFENLTLEINDTMEGYNGIYSEKDSFLYSDIGYWASSTKEQKANCYAESMRCNWSIYRPYLELIEFNYKRDVRPIIKINKNYIIE